MCLAQEHACTVHLSWELTLTSGLSAQPKKVTPQQQTAPRQQLPSNSEWEEQPYASTSDEEVPEEISARILRRIIIFSGIPTFTGFLSLPLFYYLKVCSCFLTSNAISLPLALVLAHIL
jgi:hypothetical protein